MNGDTETLTNIENRADGSWNDINKRRLSDRIGYRFRDPLLLRRALTHSSSGMPDNQRLEFLGDAVLQYLMSRILYQQYPNETEGRLTVMRAGVVCESALRGVAADISLGTCLIMSGGEEKMRGRDKPAILADAVEALVAAVCLDGGIDAAEKLVRHLWRDRLGAEYIPQEDYKSKLQQCLQAKGEQAPRYKVIKTEGPPHDPVFYTRVLGIEPVVVSGSGKSKKQAEQSAAKAAYDVLFGDGVTE